MIKVGIVMGSTSDWEVMQHSAKQLKALQIPFEAKVVSAHRTPDLLFSYAESARARNLTCIIAGAGGAAHLPGMLAAKTPVPVLGVPVATFAIGEAGAVNAALFAAALIAHEDPAVRERLDIFRANQTEAVLAAELPKPE